jgi:hypothetical protein
MADGMTGASIEGRVRTRVRGSCATAGDSIVKLMSCGSTRTAELIRG